MIKKPRPGEYYGPPEVPFLDDDFRDRMPNLYEYLTLERWQDGSVRTTSTLTIFVSGGNLKVVLNDRDNNRSAFFNASTFDSCLTEIESQLKADRVDWKSKGSSNGTSQKTPF